MANPKHLKLLREGQGRRSEWFAEDADNPDFSGANLSGINFSGLNLRHADFSNTDLQGANFEETNLFGADLTNAELGGAHFFFVNLDYAILKGANLTNAFVYSTTFLSANLVNANMAGVTMAASSFGETDLSAVKNLESVKHVAPSSIGIDTIYKSGGNIPEEFLRGCGAPDDFITYMRALTAKPIEFYSCFISYSSRDEEFAKRLHNDLQSEGVRCWFAPEDLRIGDKFRTRIDEAVRLHDKLLLVLSENSVSSQWVEKEVETAFEKEAEQGKTVLFPVQLDDAVSEIKTGWAADIRRTRHTGDFRDWKNHDSYKKAFERLMRDLKAGETR
jgi:hypothetical protein